jgi:predicted ArsR family transcriptional regulator
MDFSVDSWRTHIIGREKRAKILELMKANPEITHGELADKLGVGIRQIRRHINRLSQDGQLISSREKNS